MTPSPFLRTLPTMKKGPFFLLTAALFAGGWAGWATAGGRAPFSTDPPTSLSNSTTRPRAEETTTSRALTRDLGPVGTHADFLALALRQMDGGDETREAMLAKILADWSPEQLHAALMDSLKDPDCLLDKSPSREIARAILTAWLLRDADGAIAWFTAHENSRQREWLVVTLANHWPEGMEEQGVAILLANRGESGTRVAPGIVGKILGERARQGPASVEAFISLLRKDWPQKEWPGWLFSGDTEFPPGFDFQALLEG